MPQDKKPVFDLPKILNDLFGRKEKKPVLVPIPVRSRNAPPWVKR